MQCIGIYRHPPPPYSQVCDDREAALTTALELAETIANKSPVAVLGSKVNLNYSRDHTVQEGLDFAVSHMTRNISVSPRRGGGSIQSCVFHTRQVCPRSIPDKCVPILYQTSVSIPYCRWYGTRPCSSLKTWGLQSQHPFRKKNQFSPNCDLLYISRIYSPFKL